MFLRFNPINNEKEDAIVVYGQASEEGKEVSEADFRSVATRTSKSNFNHILTGRFPLTLAGF